MTGGKAVILGSIGDNFGAGMTGGMAFIYDPEGEFDGRANNENIVWQSVETDHWAGVVKGLVQAHEAETNSAKAAELLRNWDEALGAFVQVCPKEMLDRLDHPLSDQATKVPAE